MIRKTGILGGTFDPVHNGHLALAEAAGNICNLDEILLLPAAVPPHKQDKNITDFPQRVQMLDIAVANRPQLTVSTIEQLLPVPSFTIDTLQYLQLHSVSPVQFFFITGADTFLDILSWKSCLLFLAACDFIVFSRTGSTNKKLKQFIKKLHYRKNDINTWQHPETKKSIYHTKFVLPDISSSDVRTRLRNGKSVKSLIPADVAAYIDSESLYS